MPDPHVEALYYRFRSLNELDTFDKAKPLAGSVGRFDFVLEAGELVARPRDHFADVRTARATIEPHLESWQQFALLAESDHRISFDYDRAEVVDRSSGPDRQVYPGAAVARVLVAEAAVRRDNGDYPPPAETFIASPVTTRLIDRLRRMRDKRSEIPAAGYYVLTLLEREFKGRPAAARSLRLHKGLLNKLGELSNVNDPEIGRKGNLKGPERPLTPEELAWIRACVRLLAIRVGEREAGVPLTQLTLSNLPRL
ncbi:MAG: hypothetical protein ABSG37_07505 [Candidatus Limnocylindrales bacterium]|jgi:hypothetical protein